TSRTRGQNCEKTATYLCPFTVLYRRWKSSWRTSLRLVPLLSFAFAKFGLRHRNRAATPPFLLHDTFHDSDKAVRTTRQTCAPLTVFNRAGRKFAPLERFPCEAAK